MVVFIDRREKFREVIRSHIKILSSKQTYETKSYRNNFRAKSAVESDFSV